MEKNNISQDQDIDESDSNYYSHPRFEVAQLVPKDARTIIDVGCARGSLGKLLKEMRSDRKVFGIEIVPEVD